eukprot:6173970-Pleurochrysis_carterae.AAC.2
MARYQEAAWEPADVSLPLKCPLYMRPPVPFHARASSFPCAPRPCARPSLLPVCPHPPSLPSADAGAIRTVHSEAHM